MIMQNSTFILSSPIMSDASSSNLRAKTNLPMLFYHPLLHGHTTCLHHKPTMSSGTKRKLVALSETGCPPVSSPTEEGGKRSLCFKIHGFKQMCDSGDSMDLETNSVEAFGFQWALTVLLNVAIYEQSSERCVKAFLIRKDDLRVETTVTGWMRCLGRKISLSIDEESEFEDSEPGNLLRMSKVEDAVDQHGTLTVDVELEITSTKTLLWMPKDEEVPYIRKLHYADNADNETSDITFKLGQETFNAHRSVLALRAPKLLKSVGKAKTKVIKDVGLDVFRAALLLIYTCNDICIVENPSWKAQELIEFADEYDLPYIRLYAESWLARDLVSVENTAELLMFAEKMKCPLLKEAAIAKYKESPLEVMQSEGWEDVKASNDLMEDLLYMTNVVKNDRDDIGFAQKHINQLTEKDIECMSVTNLRTRLEEKKVENLLGDRDVLVDRLKESLRY